MSIIIRQENEKDYQEVENLTREAFWDLYHPGCTEHLIVHKIRKGSSFIPELDFVALLENKIVGNIIYTKSNIVDKDNNQHGIILQRQVYEIVNHNKAYQYVKSYIYEGLSSNS